MKYAILTASGITGTVLAAAAWAQQAPVAPSTPVRAVTETSHTTRLSASTPYEQAIAVTQLLYPATNEQNRPHAIILARVDQPASALLAVSRLTHFPTNAPLLFADRDGIPQVTLDEIKRLAPDGSTYDGNVQLYLVGQFGSRVEEQLRMVIKPRESVLARIQRFPTDDPIQLAEDLDRWSTRVHGTPPQATVILQLRNLPTGYPSAYWNAHMGHAVLFVDGETIPEPTRRALARRWDHTAFMYLFGSENVISAKVQAELQRYGLVRRVPGKDAIEVASTFVGYRDAGRSTRFGVGTRPRDFGWGIATAGHNFTFASPDDWHSVISGAVLAHLGKHAPLLLVQRDALPTPVVRFLGMVRPTVTEPGGQLLNHGWVLGNVSRSAQVQIDGILSPVAPQVQARRP